MSLRKISAIALLACSASAVNAAEIEPILTVGIESCGDDLVTTTALDLRAGGGINLGAGVSIAPEGSTFSARITLNYLFDSVEFESPTGEADFDVLPLNIGLFKTYDRHEFGYGVSMHINPSTTISSASPALNGTINFDNATGAFLEYHYVFSRAEAPGFSTDTYFAIRATSIKYEAAGYSSTDAGGVGIYLGSKF